MRRNIKVPLFATITALIATVGLTPDARAQGVPYETEYATGAANQRSARIVVAPRLHPEVEVSRTLAAQPVHPHMAKVIVGDGGASQHTWIDPMQHLHGLDENHSLVKAQRLHLSLSGVTQRELDQHRIHAKQLESTYAGQSRARVVVMPRNDAPDDAGANPIMVIPRPATAPIPTVPKAPEPDTKNQTVAQATTD